MLNQSFCHWDNLIFMENVKMCIVHVKDSLVLAVCVVVLTRSS